MAFYDRTIVSLRLDARRPTTHIANALARNCSSKVQQPCILAHSPDAKDLLPSTKVRLWSIQQAQRRRHDPQAREHRRRDVHSMTTFLNTKASHA